MQTCLLASNRLSSLETRLPLSDCVRMSVLGPNWGLSWPSRSTWLKGLLITTLVQWTYRAAYELINTPKSKYHTWRSLLKHYLCNHALTFMGFIAHRDLQLDSMAFQDAQGTFLMRQIEANRHTLYGRRHRFEHIRNVLEFRSHHPLTRMAHYQEYVRLIHDEDRRDVLTQTPAMMLAVTSGTSGQSALIPTNSHIPATFFFKGVALMFYKISMMLELPFHITQADLPMLKITHQKSMKLMFPAVKRFTPHGLRIGPNSSGPEDSRKLQFLYTTPQEAYEIMDEDQLMYVHLLFGLRDPMLGMIEVNFASLLLRAMRFMATHFQGLCHDIEHGTLTPPGVVAPEILDKLTPHLVADPERAEFLRAKTKYGFGDIVIQIWPQIHTILTTTSGAQEPYRFQLRKSFIQFGCIYSPFYGATEGLLGVNLDPNTKPSEDSTPLYTLTPRAQFYEFIPVSHCDEDQPKTLLGHELTWGEEYELVITNNSGLYRYRLGDVIRVKGYYNELPKVEFCYRIGQVLNLRGEKITEQFLNNGLKKQFSGLTKHPQMEDFACVESPLTGGEDPPHYVLFIEFPKPVPDVKITEILINQWFDREHEVYRSFRQKGSIGPLQIKVVRPKGFHELVNFIRSENQSGFTQVKVPRVLTHDKYIQFISQRLVEASN